MSEHGVPIGPWQPTRGFFSSLLARRLRGERIGRDAELPAVDHERLLRAALHWSRLRQHPDGQEHSQQRLVELYGWFTEGFDTTDLQEVQGVLQAGPER